MPPNEEGRKERRRAHDSDSDHDLLINITNKVNNAIELFIEHRKDQTKKIEDHEARLRLTATKEELDMYTKKSEFEPVKNIVYGAVTLILVAVVGALIAQVVMQ